MPSPSSKSRNLHLRQRPPLPLPGWLWLVAVCAVPLTLSSSPLKYPQRMVNGHSVDLTPLCRWWTNHSGERPLTAWVHVTGNVVGTNSWGWIIEGNPPRRSDAHPVESATPPAGVHPNKMILLHPPLADLGAFQELGRELKSLNEKHAQLAGEQSQMKSRQQAVAREKSAQRLTRQRSRALEAEKQQLAASENQAKNQINLVDRQIAVLKKKLALFPGSDHYVLDCFALDTGQDTSGVPVYDHGSVLQN